MPGCEEICLSQENHKAAVMVMEEMADKFVVGQQYEVFVQVPD